MGIVNIKVRMDPQSVATLAQMTEGAVSRALSRAASRIERYAKEITPVSTGWKDTARYGPSGTLRDSIVVSPSLKTITILWTAPYAKWADEGAPPHTITGNPNLHFFWRNAAKWLRTPSVRHPGYTGHRFSDHMRIVAPQFVQEAIIEELQGLNIP
jgi:hypothetical protein